MVQIIHSYAPLCAILLLFLKKISGILYCKSKSVETAAQSFGNCYFLMKFSTYDKGHIDVQ